MQVVCGHHRDFIVFGQEIQDRESDSECAPPSKKQCQQLDPESRLYR